MLAPPLASLLNEKSILSYAYRAISILYHRYSESVHYIFRAIALHTYGSAQYIFFRQRIISFWRSHSPYSQLYSKQEEINASELH
jgi:hypothetical protein